MQSGSCSSPIKSFFWTLFRIFFFALFFGRIPLEGNPTGGVVTAGAASINTIPGTVTIQQTSSAAIINWQSFSIAAGELTRFVQPSSTSAVLNRVLGGQTSIINGTLEANGQVYLINGNGIIVGAGGMVNSASFVASTRDIADADFLSGNMHFTGSGSGSVQNLGRITALGGDVVLIGRTVDNEGTIRATKGTAGLIAADDVTLAQKNPDGSTILVRPSATAAVDSSQVGVHNRGTITAVAAELKAANGNIYALAIQNEGAIRATGGFKQGGRVWLTSGGVSILNTGRINVSARRAGGSGGTVAIKSEGGTVTQSGPILARGGPGGAGGNVEISGAQVHVTGMIDLTAPGGPAGTLLLDPTTFTIATAGGDITPANVVSMLALANVIFSATSTITVSSQVNAVTNSDAHVLTLDAPTVDLNQAILLGASETLAGTATTVHVGASGLVQNGIDVASATMSGTISLANATYTLTGSQLLINKSLTLEGNGAILNANNASRVLEIDGNGSGITVTLDDLTFENGDGLQGNKSGAAGSTLNAYGGGILNYAENGRKTNVTLENSTVTADKVNAAIDGGGGIDNDGAESGSATLIITHSSVSHNVAVLQAEISSDGAVGGGIYNDGENSGTAILSILNGSLVTLNTADTTVNGLYGSGGAIFNDAGISGTATATLDDSMITFNTTDYGGGVYNNSGLTGVATLNVIDNSIVSNNLAEQNGGAIFNDHAALTISSSTLSNNRANYVGGVMETSGPLEMIANSTLANNSAAFGGGAIYHDGSSNNAPDDLVLTEDVFTGNTAGTFGGAVLNDGGGIDNFSPGSGLATTEINNSTFSGNVASQGAAILNISTAAASVVTVTGGTITGNGGASTADGGGIMNRSGGALKVIGVTISNNKANFGAGIYDSGGSATLSGSTISNNIAATSGGGIYDSLGIFSLINSTVSGNTAVNGAGLYTQGVTPASVSGSLFTGNMATTDGGGIYAFGLSTLQVQSSTLTGNSAAMGGGVYVTSPSGGAMIKLTGITLAGNSATTSGGGIFISGGGAVTTASIKDDGSIVSDNAVGGSESDYAQTGNVTLTSGYDVYGQNGAAGGYVPVSADLLLSGGIGTLLATNGGGALLLQDNGGPTKTIALIPGSIALNTGNPADIGTLDQRGVVRGSATAYTLSEPDIGAYEAQFVSIQGNDITVSYGTAVPTPTYTLTNGPINSASLVSGSVVIVTPETQAGVYANDIGQGSIAVAGPTYFLDFTPGKLTISPDPLIITANDAHRAYSGTAFHGGNGVTYSGFVLGQDASVLTGGALLYGGTSQGAIDSGTYGIGLSGPTSTNYAIAFVPGTLYIDPLATVPPLQPITAVAGLVEAERRKIELYPGDGDAVYFYSGDWRSGKKVIAELSSADLGNSSTGVR